MVTTSRFNPWIGCLLMATTGLVGCAPKTNVSATGNVPAQYSRVIMSIQEIWFHASATAGPDDTGWVKFPLTTPATIDLAASVGSLSAITSGLAVPAGTYAQIRLIPVDSGSPLLSSAQNLGAVYNCEVDYTDTTNTLRQVPLELQNPDKGIGIAKTITVSSSSGNATIFSGSRTGTSTTGTNTTDTTGTATTGTTGTTTTTTGTTNGTTATTGTTGTTTTAATTTASNLTYSLAINVDGAKDLVPFAYGSANGLLLNPHVTAYDASAVGAISGTLILTGLTGIASASTTAFDNIQVTAESLSSDGTRHIAVNSAPVRSDGTFTLYPLATSSSSPTTYDLVIHGPAIATIIVKGVTVTVGSSSTITPVSIGTITPRAATSFSVNLTTTTPLPAGSLVGFYQTLPSTTGATEAPYLIEEQPVDPFSRRFDADETLSAATIDYGTFSGSAVSLTAANPTDGASTYHVAASAPLFADGALTATVSPTAVLATVPTLSPASGITSAPSLSLIKTATSTYDQGDLIVSHDGAIVATAILDPVMGHSAASTLTLSGLPGGTGTANSALYYVSIRVWNSTNPRQSLNRVTYSNALDLSTGSNATYSIQLP